MHTVDELNDLLIDLSFSEDIGDGDHTTLCCIPDDAMGKSQLIIKEDGILAGIRIAKEVFHRFDASMQVQVLIEDGSHVKKGDVAMIVTGKVRRLLQTERLMLNCHHDRKIRRSPQRHKHPRSRHEKNHARNANAGERSCENRRRRQPPHRTFRYDSPERQPH